MVGFDGCGLFFCIGTPITIDLIKWSGCSQFAITIEFIVYSYVLCCILVTPIIVLSVGVTLSVFFPLSRTTDTNHSMFLDEFKTLLRLFG